MKSKLDQIHSPRVKQIAFALNDYIDNPTKIDKHDKDILFGLLEQIASTKSNSFLSDDQPLSQDEILKIDAGNEEEISSKEKDKNNIDTYFKEAEEAVAAKDYQKAIAIYSSIMGNNDLSFQGRDIHDDYIKIYHALSAIYKEQLDDAVDNKVLKNYLNSEYIKYINLELRQHQYVNENNIKIINKEDVSQSDRQSSIDKIKSTTDQMNKVITLIGEDKSIITNDYLVQCQAYTDIPLLGNDDHVDNDN
jgi:hypothetical protein